MPIILEGRKHSVKYDKGSTHKFEVVRVWVIGDILVQLYTGWPNRNNVDRFIGHAKERSNVWVYQIFPPNNHIDEGLLDQLMRESRNDYYSVDTVPS